jgi:ABC-2 type transport system ATP-binding protein
MINLEHASRWYGHVIGVNDISCDIKPGLTALLGPNGAGKSTLLKLVTGQIKPTTGSVKVMGHAPFGNVEVYRQLGYCPEVDGFYEEMSGREFVSLLAAMSGLSGEELRKRVDESIERVGMSERANQKIGGYSKGMRQRIKLAQAIVHAPRVLILDEPLNGLDPVGRQEYSALLTKLAESGLCILISSHVLYEVEQLTRNILLINRGRLVAQGDIYQIRSLIDRHPHRISIVSSEARTIARELIGLPCVLAARIDAKSPHVLEVETSQPEQFYKQFPEIALAGKFEIESFHSPDNNLESVFNYLVNP